MINHCEDFGFFYNPLNPWKTASYPGFLGLASPLSVYGPLARLWSAPCLTSHSLTYAVNVDAEDDIVLSLKKVLEQNSLFYDLFLFGPPCIV